MNLDLVSISRSSTAIVDPFGDTDPEVVSSRNAGKKSWKNIGKKHRIVTGLVGYLIRCI